MRIRYIIVIAAVFILGCNKQSTKNEQIYLLQSAAWYQHSAEMSALYYQSFNWATDIVKDRVRQRRDNPPAVVLDIDETVLDNSPVTGFQILENKPYSDEIWENWCNLAEAEPLPGALEFTKMARKAGVEVFYISNRKENLMHVTIDNMEKLGFPNADSLHILLKSETSSKDARREMVSSNYDIILFIGDNLGDFDGAFDNRTNGIAKKLVHDRPDQFGTKFILLPNPIYGTWDKPYKVGEGSPVENKRSALRSF